MPDLHRRPGALVLAAALLVALALASCRRPERGPRELLDRYFSTAARQDYGATWECYDRNYRSKVPRDEYVRRRGEASRLVSWATVAIEEHGDTARADVDLVFAPSPRLGQPGPARAKVVEELVREREGWRIKVW